MKSAATDVKSYLNELPEDRKSVMALLLQQIKTNLPKGFEEVMQYGMVSYVVPHKLYPKGYHCDPKVPLPFLSVASQKNFIAVYHMGIYADERLLNWFTGEFGKHSSKKLDMGKSCIRFKKPEDIPLELIGALAKKMTPADWIALYESAFKK